MIDLRRLAKVLRHANTSPPSEARQEFYALKQAILEAYGQRDGDDIQEIVKPCWGYRYAPCDEHCDKCGGTGTYERKLVHLERWNLGGLVFHRPARYLAFTVWPISIKGRIEHKPSRFAFAAWRALSLVFAPSMHLYFDQFRMDEKQLRRMKKMLAFLLGFDRSKWATKALTFPEIIQASVKAKIEKRREEMVPF